MGRYQRPTIDPQDVSPERQLLGAVLHQAVTDARGTAHGHKVPAHHIAEARCFLRDSDTVSALIEISGADPAVVYPVLLREAGMEDAP